MVEQEILMVSKQDAPLTEDEVKKVFETSGSLDKIKRAVEKAKDRLYATWATVDAVDKDGQKVPIDEAIEQQKILMNRNAPIQDTHTNKNVGKTIAYRILEHPIAKKLGILHLNKIYSDNILDDKVWTETANGERQGSSVGGFSTDRQMESDGISIFESLKGFNWLETSNVKSGANQFATNHAVSLIAKQDKMVKEIKKEEGDMSTETPEVSMDDRVARLEDALGAVMAKLDELVQASAGTPEVDKEGEDNPATNEPDKEVEKEAETDSEETEKEEEEDKEEDEVAKTLKSIQSELKDVKKQLEANKVVEVVKSERPAEVNKAEKTSHKFEDVMKGKVSLAEFTGKQ